MLQTEFDSRPYSRAERLSDASVHVIGLVSALMAVPVLITLAALWRGDAPAVVATSIYGVTLIAMLGFSALYHMGYRHRARWLYMRLDYGAIYFKIAGTYTPFVILSGGHGWMLLTGLWGAAIAGTSLRALAPDRFRWLALSLYIGMGWAGVVLGRPLLSTLSWPVLILMMVGGVIYTSGVAFFLSHRLPFHTTIWHAFVLAASGVFFAAVLVHLIQTS
ncbi:MAG: hemolysin III family protein [Rhodobacteraceae bacterium]|nr:hemolysin III family protein [Paracoccaceae bacterium]